MTQKCTLSCLPWLIIISVIILAGYIYYRSGAQLSGFADYPSPSQTTKPELTNPDPVYTTEFIYAGYNDIYDYIISKALLDLLNQHEARTRSRPTSILTESILFEDIPRIYLYISKDAPAKANLVFSKLKKPDSLIQLESDQLNKYMQFSKPSALDTEKTIDPLDVPERASISDGQYQNIFALIRKHNITRLPTLDFTQHIKQIQQYLAYMKTVNPDFFSNIIFTPKELELLDVDKDSLPQPAGLNATLQMNPKYISLTSQTPAVNHPATFTTLLTTAGMEYNFIFGQEMESYLVNSATESLKRDIQNFLFKNTTLGINISPDRLALFQVSMVNSFQVNVFYKLKEYIGNMELTNTELANKLEKVLKPADNLTPAKLKALKEKALLNQQANNGNKDMGGSVPKVVVMPDRFFNMMYNEFQAIKVVVKQNEQDLSVG
jgi:hypothetical protein